MSPEPDRTFAVMLLWKDAAIFQTMVRDYLFQISDWFG
jgi:hypothetical protein